MRSHCKSSGAPLGAVSATVLGIYIFVGQMLAAPEPVKAGEAAGANPVRQAAPVSSEPAPGTSRPSSNAAPRADLDASDELAALEAVQIALSEVGDGSSYVWYRRNGRLSGLIQPTFSFKDHSGNVCRHLIVSLSSGAYTRKVEGIACRLLSGVWQLDG